MCLLSGSHRLRTSSSASSATQSPLPARGPTLLSLTAEAGRRLASGRSTTELSAIFVPRISDLTIQAVRLTRHRLGQTTLVGSTRLSRFGRRISLRCESGFVTFVLGELQSHEFDPASVKIEPPIFRLLLEEFDLNKHAGERTGAAFQGIVFGFLRADDPYISDGN